MTAEVTVETTDEIPTVTEAFVAPRLLAGWTETGTRAGFVDHLARYGPLPDTAPRRRHRSWLIDAVELAGLRGRGGAGFPTARKLAAVAAARGPRHVVANGCEGDPTSGKDHALLEVAPHLVLDGAMLAAGAVDAAGVIVCVHSDGIAAHVLDALRERGSTTVPFEVVEVPAGYVASEESALVNFLATGDARPTVKPPRPAERGVRGRPTLVDNVETLAHLALIARYGPDWYRGAGTAASPGTTLVTIDGAVAFPGVYETAFGTQLGEVLGCAGGVTEPVQALLVGGLGGSWLDAGDAAGVAFTHEDVRIAGAALGVAALVALPAGACGIAETARVLRYLAGESAAQCGPCMFGLPAIAADLAELAQLGDRTGAVLGRLRRRLGVIPGRGACGHPDGAVRLAASALRVFADDVDAHAAGRPCPGAHASPWLPTS